MGNVNTFLTDDDYRQLNSETGFTEHQIRRLYSRFSHLDKRSKGYLERQDLMLIPELAVNPLGTRIIEAFFTEEKDPRESVETINFRQFVRTLARFKRTPKAQQHEMNTKEKKMDCFPAPCVVYHIMRASEIYDTDRDGKISKEDLGHVLKAMVGLHITNDELTSIVRRTMKEADKDQDGFIDFEEFMQTLSSIDLDEKMSIRFLQT